MSINFCHDELTTSIICDKVCFDEHEVTNLISAVMRERQKGFLAGNFIRPPVAIQLTFTCDININRIVLGCSVGQQKSAAFEVSTVVDNYSQPQNKVGFCYVPPGKNTVVFHVHGKAPSIPDSRTQYEAFRTTRFLFKVRGIAVKIFKTEGSSIPALGKLEVWGIPSRSARKEQIAQVNTIWGKICMNVASLCVRTVKEVKEIKNEQAPKMKAGITIPEEFIDPISCEIMTIPMTLPSGKVIDVTTLEKFHIAEEKWGRGKSDPFTGKPFSRSSGPVVATALKARMDKFLLENSDSPELQKIPRTVGKRLPSWTDYSDTKKQKTGETTIPEPSRYASTVDELLFSSLAGLPSFLEKPPEEEPEQCLKCLNKSNLFKLPCEHLICRSCLVLVRSTREQNKCSRCNSSFQLSEPVRFHTGK